MKKKLKIKFWKAEKALAMQILEQEGLPKQKYNGVIRISGGITFVNETLYLRGIEEIFDFDIDSKSFESNQDRDAYLNKITQAITDEMFTNRQVGFKVGDVCEFSDDKKEWVKDFYSGSILNRNAETEFLSSEDMKSSFYVGWKYARPLAKRIEPKVEENGEIITYTWEEE